MTALLISLIVICLLFALSSGSEQKANKGTRVHPLYGAEPAKPSLPPLSDAEREALQQAEEVWDDDTASKIRNRTYDGPLPDYDGAYWSSIYPDIYHTKIVGINFCKGIKDLVNSYFDAELIAEPKNKFDPNAIKIVHKDSGRKVGYIPADETDSVRRFLNDQLPYPCRAKINEDEEWNNSTDRYRKFLYGSINIIRPTT